eukprot:1437157-Prymnesium_polylepis.3
MRAEDGAQLGARANVDAASDEQMRLPDGTRRTKHWRWVWRHAHGRCPIVTGVQLLGPLARALGGDDTTVVIVIRREGDAFRGRPTWQCQLGHGWLRWLGSPHGVTCSFRWRLQQRLQRRPCVKRSVVGRLVLPGRLPLHDAEPSRNVGGVHLGERVAIGFIPCALLLVHERRHPSAKPAVAVLVVDLLQLKILVNLPGDSDVFGPHPDLLGCLFASFQLHFVQHE